MHGGELKSTICCGIAAKQSSIWPYLYIPVVVLLHSSKRLLYVVVGEGIAALHHSTQTDVVFCLGLVIPLNPLPIAAATRILETKAIGKAGPFCFYLTTTLTDGCSQVQSLSYFLLIYAAM